MHHGLRPLWLVPPGLLPSHACAELIGLDDYRSDEATSTGDGGHEQPDAVSAGDNVVLLRCDKEGGCPVVP